MDRLLEDTAERIFGDHVDKAVLDAAEAGEFPGTLWQVVRDTGLHVVGSAGTGTGGRISTACLGSVQRWVSAWACHGTRSS